MPLALSTYYFIYASSVLF